MSNISHFDPVVGDLSNGVEERSLEQFWLSSHYLFDSIFSSIGLIDELHNGVEGIKLHQ